MLCLVLMAAPQAVVPAAQLPSCQPSLGKETVHVLGESEWLVAVELELAVVRTWMVKLHG